MIRLTIRILIYIYWLIIRSLRLKRRVILYYHSIKPTDKARFAAQMEYLSRHYEVVPLQDILEGTSSGRKCISITFDDAYVSVLRYGIPVMESRGMQASVFVPAGLAGNTPVWLEGSEYEDEDEDEEIMDWDQLCDLVDRGHLISSHTVWHSRLTDLSAHDCTKELIESRKRIQEELEVPADIISYPYGHFNQEVMNRALKAGYTHGVTVIPETVEQKRSSMETGRVAVSPSDSIHTLRIKADGAYSASLWPRKIKKNIMPGSTGTPGSQS